MKTRIKTIIAVAFLLFPLLVLAQPDDTPWKDVSARSNHLRGKLSGKKYTLTYISRGSHFYHDNFLAGKLTLEDGEIYDSIMVRYNSFIDELVCYNPNTKALFTIDKFLLKEFEVASPVFGYQRFRKMKFANNPDGGRFFLVLYEGRINLLAFYKTKELKSSAYKDSNGIMKDTEYILTETFYTYSPEKGFNRFAPYKESFLNLYSKNKKQVRQILRKNRLNNFNIFNLGVAFSQIENAGIRD